MRKMVLLIVALTVCSFGMVYAQDTYSTNVNETYQESKAIKSEEIKKVEQEAKKSVQDEIKNEQNEKIQEEQKDKKQIQEEQGKLSSQETKAVKTSTSNNTKTKAVSRNNNHTNVKPDKKAEEEKTVKEKNEKLAPQTNNSNGDPIIDTSNANNGSIKAKYLNNKKLKVMITKGEEMDAHDLKGDNSYQSFPLQHGDGIYKISIMENIGGKEYKYILTKEVEVKTTNPNAKYLTSVQMINWNNSMAAIQKAKSLTKGCNDQQKVNKIYSYVINKITYDTSITKLPSGYTPKIDSVFKNGSGICYDFASLFAGMLRSVGVPTKLIMGQASKVEGYHAWNQVYVNGKWRIIDTSFDAQYRAAGHSVTQYKSGGYTTQKQY